MYYNGVDHLHVLEWERCENYVEQWVCRVPNCEYAERRFIECI